MELQVVRRQLVVVPEWLVGQVGDAASEVVVVAGKFDECFGDVVGEHVESAVEVEDAGDAAAAVGVEAEVELLACFAAVLVWAVVEPAAVVPEVRMDLASPISQAVP